MKIIKYIKEYVESEALKVTKKELVEFDKKHIVNVSQADAEWLAIECGDNEFVGYIIGDINNLNKSKPNLEFIDRYSFIEDYKIIKEEQ